MRGGNGVSPIRDDEEFEAAPSDEALRVGPPCGPAAPLATVTQGVAELDQELGRPLDLLRRLVDLPAEAVEANRQVVIGKCAHGLATRMRRTSAATSSVHARTSRRTQSTSLVTPANLDGSPGDAAAAGTRPPAAP